MFIEALIFSIIIGYLLKGKIKNLEKVNIEKIYLVFIAFFIEFIIVMGIKKSYFKMGYITYSLDLIMYGLLGIFTYINRKNYYILLMGIGFILNAIPIFFNGGAMPVGRYAIDKTGLTYNVSTEGLYTLIDSKTRFSFLGDVIPFSFLSSFAISIGDIIAAVGLILFIVTGMKNMPQCRIEIQK